MKYRLNKAETVPVRLCNVAATRNINGRTIVTYTNSIKLSPNEVYETEDEAMIEWFRKHRRKVRYSRSLENALKDANVPYSIELCQSCGGKVQKISYQMVEVME